MGVTGRDGVCSLEFPMGRVFVAISPADYRSDWLGLDQTVEFTFYFPSPE